MATDTTHPLARLQNHAPPWPVTVVIGVFAAALSTTIHIASTRTGAAAGGAAADSVGVATQGGTAELGLAWLAAEAVALGGVIAAALLYRRLSDRWRIVAEYGFRTVIGIYATWLLAPALGVYEAAILVLAAWTAMQLLDEVGLFWPLYDIGGVTVAVVAALAFGGVFSPWLFVGLAVAIAAYDHLLADRSSAMFRAGAGLVRWRLPVLVVVPARLRFCLLDFATRLRDGSGDDVGGAALGTGDLFLGGAFVASLTFAGADGAVVWATAAAGVVGLAGAYVLKDDGGAGMPWIYGGMVPVYLTAVVVGWVGL